MIPLFSSAVNALETDAFEVWIRGTIALIAVMAVIEVSASIFWRSGSSNYYGPYGMMGGGYAGMIMILSILRK